MWSVIRSLWLTALFTATLTSTQAEELSNDDIRRLDNQVQDAKSVALGIAAELNMLEQKLLYPSGTQVNVYLSIARRTDARPGAVELSIDGEVATNYIYGSLELEALQKGGVQKLYVGNIAEGSHELRVTITGKLGDGADFTQTLQHVFTKGVKPKVLNISLAQPGDDGNRILVGDR